MFSDVVQREVHACRHCGRVLVFSRDPLSIGHEVPECAGFTKMLAEFEREFGVTRSNARTEWMDRAGRATRMGEA